MGRFKIHQVAESFPSHVVIINVIDEGYSRKKMTHPPKVCALEWLWLFQLNRVFYFLEKPK
jgi:hypothetical protein